MAVITKGGSPILGLDIGAAFIKAVEMRPGKGALAITGVGVLPTPPGCIVNDEIVDPVVLATAVKQLLAENGIKTKNVIASVAGQSSVVVRVIDVPRMTDKELAETMRWEIDRHIPFSPDEVVKDYSPIARPNDDPNSPNMAVLLAVAQNNVVGGLLQTILAAGLTPVAIDVESLASARSLLDVDESFGAQTVALVNIGATKTDVGIYEAGTLAFPRTIPVAGNAMTEAVASTLSIDAADAERLKKQSGEVPADAAARFGAALQTPEETFEFGDFSGGIDFAAPGAAGTPAGGMFGGQDASAPGGFAATPEGPVFGDPSTFGVPPAEEPTPAFGATPFGGAAFDATGAAPGGFAETVDGPTFGDPAFGATPSFGDPEPTVPPNDPAFGASAFAGAGDAPTFDLPDVGPANNGPVFTGEGDFAMDQTDTPPVTTEPVALTPDGAPLQPPTVPDVVSDADRRRHEISDAFMPVVVELAGELKRSLEYYSTRANNARVDRVVVFGGVANLPGLTAFLESEIGVPVQTAKLPGIVSLGSNAVSVDYLQQISALLPVATGLAARAFIATEAPAPRKAEKPKKAGKAK